MKLPTRIVEKPWGRTDIPACFGDFAGRRVGEIWFEHPDGDAAPLMVKFLFTSERLSIQVHPNDAAAIAAGLPRGKEECWLVIEATADAELGVGLTKNCSKDELRAAIECGSIASLIDWRSAQAGDFIYNPAGTIHALGGGLTVVEVQQNIDCTYRLYDYGRPRDLHVEAALRVATLGPHRDGRDRQLPTKGQVSLVNGPHFNLVRAHGPIDPGRFNNARALQVVPLNGGCIVDGEAVTLGECAVTERVTDVQLAPNAMALLCWEHKA